MGDSGSWIGAGVDPRVTGADVVLDRRLRVYFDEPMEDNAALRLPGNYAITVIGVGDPVTVLSVVPSGSLLYVDLVTLEQFTPGILNYRVTVSNVEDQAGNPIDPAHDSADFDGEATLPGTGAARIGLIEAMTGAIGESDNEIGGYRITRLTAATVAGDTTLQVESTLDWPDAGVIALDGWRYYYASKTITSLDGITHIDLGSPVPGVAKIHAVDSGVMDISGEWTALDHLRRAMLVEYAEGEDLDAIGRNLGVPRLPVFEDDDQFREVIKALAYNPKGTWHGIDLALQAMLGVGGYEIIEDLLQFPNTVFIQFSGSSLSSDEYWGKTFLTNTSYGLINAGGIGLDKLPANLYAEVIGSVRLYDLDRLFSFRTAIPGNVTYGLYPGALGLTNAFTYQGTLPEGTAVTLDAAGFAKIATSDGTSVGYYMADIQGARVVPESNVEMSWLVRIPTGATIGGATYREQCSLILRDGEYEVAVGVAVNASQFDLGLFDPAGSGFLGTTVTLGRDTWYEVVLRKRGRDWAEVWVDGKLIHREPYSSFTSATGQHRALFGILASGAGIIGMELHTKQLGLQFITHKDFWAAHGAAGAVAAANPDQFDSGIAGLFVTADIGKRLDIRGSSASNAQGGNNNGSWVVDSLVGASPAQAVVVVGPDREDAGVAASGRITVPAEHPFTYPDDLGKSIVISGSGSGNDGTYLITGLIDDGTLVDLSTYSTPVRATTTICEVVHAFTAEGGLDWHLEPAHVNESGLEFELSDAGDLVDLGVSKRIDLRQALWVSGLVMYVTYSTIPSGQMLPVSEILNTLVSGGPPPVFTHYPFYLYDPLGILAGFLDTITAAGVIPEYLLA